MSSKHYVRVSHEKVDVTDFDGAPEIPEEKRGGGGSGLETVRRHRGLRLVIDTEVLNEHMPKKVQGCSNSERLKTPISFPY